MIGSAALALAAALTAASPASAPDSKVAPAVIADPPRDALHPAHNKQLLIPSHGVGMNALLLAAAGEGTKPTVILMHGLPGNERNLDLAQAIRRAGWNVLAFTYRGAWGSPGDFSISNAMEDGKAALAFARSDEGGRLGIDRHRIVLMGHSLGAFVAAQTSAGGEVAGLVLIDSTNMGLRHKRLAATGEEGRAAAVAALDDFGNALHGATPESVTDEIISRGGAWDLTATAPQLSKVPTLSVFASHGNASENRDLAKRLEQAGNSRVSAVEFDTDHSFADRRIGLSSAIVDWLLHLTD